MTSINALDPTQRTLNGSQTGLAPEEGKNKKSSETVLSTFKSLNEQEAAESLDQKRVEPLELMPMEGKAAIDKAFEQVMEYPYDPKKQNVVDDFIYQFFTNVAHDQDISNLQPRIDQIRQLHPDNQKALLMTAFALSKGDSVIRDQNILTSLRVGTRNLNFDLTKEQDLASFIRNVINPRYSAAGRSLLGIGFIGISWAISSFVNKYVFPSLKLGVNFFNECNVFEGITSEYCLSRVSREQIALRSKQDTIAVSLLVIAAGLAIAYNYPAVREEIKNNRSITKVFEDSIQRLLENQKLEKALALCESNYSAIPDLQLSQVGKMALDRGRHELVIKVANAMTSKMTLNSKRNVAKLFEDYIQKLLANQEIEKAVALCENNYSAISDAQMNQIGTVALDQGRYELVIKVAKTMTSKENWISKRNAMKLLNSIPA